MRGLGVAWVTVEIRGPRVVDILDLPDRAVPDIERCRPEALVGGAADLDSRRDALDAQRAELERLRSVVAGDIEKALREQQSGSVTGPS